MDSHHRQRTSTRITSFLSGPSIYRPLPNSRLVSRTPKIPRPNAPKPAQTFTPSAKHQILHLTNTNTITLLPQPPTIDHRMLILRLLHTSICLPHRSGNHSGLPSQHRLQHAPTTLQNPTQPSRSLSSLFESNSSQNHVDLLPKIKARVPHQRA